MQTEVAEQWRQAVLDQLEALRAQPARQDAERSLWMGSGLGLGIPLWAARPEGPPPALKAIDLRVVDNLLSNAVWVSCVCGGPLCCGGPQLVPPRRADCVSWVLVAPHVWVGICQVLFHLSLAWGACVRHLSDVAVGRLRITVHVCKCMCSRTDR